MLKKEKRKRKKANLQRARERPKAPNLVSFPKVAHKTKKKKSYHKCFFMAERKKVKMLPCLAKREKEQAIVLLVVLITTSLSPWSSDKSETEH